MNEAADRRTWHSEVCFAFKGSRSGFQFCAFSGWFQGALHLGEQEGEDQHLHQGTRGQLWQLEVPPSELLSSPLSPQPAAFCVSFPLPRVPKESNNSFSCATYICTEHLLCVHPGLSNEAVIRQVFLGGCKNQMRLEVNIVQHGAWHRRCKGTVSETGFE